MDSFKGAGVLTLNADTSGHVAEAHASHTSDARGQEHWVTTTHQIHVTIGKLNEGLATNPHYNEFFSTNSMLPEFCCALNAGWFMLGRLYHRLGLPYSTVFTVAVLLLWIPIYTMITWDCPAQQPNPSSPKRQQPPQPCEMPASLAATGSLALLAVLAITVWLRRLVRGRFHIPGGVCEDVCCVVPWMCGLPCQGFALEVASMDRQLAPSRPVHPGPSIDTTTGQTQWSSSIFGCNTALDGDCPQFYTSLVFPCFIQSRVLLRLQIGKPWATVCGLLMLQTVLPAVMVIVAAATGSVAFLATVVLLWLLDVYGSIVNSWLRMTVRKRLGIFGTISDDVIMAVCCPVCSLAQLERETLHLAPLMATAGAEINGDPKGAPFMGGTYLSPASAGAVPGNGAYGTVPFSGVALPASSYGSSDTSGPYSSSSVPQYGATATAAAATAVAAPSAYPAPDGPGPQQLNAFAAPGATRFELAVL